jgi:flagellar basal-body rod protein FlgC
MGITKTPTSVDIAVSGLRAESLRMNVIARNIANANTSRTESGQPYRRQQVVLGAEQEAMAGVSVEEVAADMLNPFKRVYQPGHPDADKDGYVLMPNVDLPVEMMHMMAASRAYQANAAVLKRYQEMVNVTLELLR